jgi:hypothetical protein
VTAVPGHASAAALDGKSVVVVTSEGLVGRVDKHGGQLVTLATGLGSLFYVVVGGCAAFVLDAAGTITRVPLDGGPPSTLATDDGAAAMHAYDGRLYWSTHKGAIRSIPSEGGDTTTLATDAGNLVGIVARGEWVFVTDFDGLSIRKVPRAGGPPETVTATITWPFGIRVDDDWVYTANGDVTVSRVAR